MKIADLMESPAKEQSGPESSLTPATPEEQAAYERVVIAGMQAMYADKTRDKLLSFVQSKVEMEGPAQALASVVQQLVVQLDQQSGGKIPGEVILPVAAELLSHMTELATEAGLVEADPSLLGQAGQILVMGVADHYGIDPDEIEELLATIPPEQVESMVSEQAGIAPAAKPDLAGMMGEGGPGGIQPQ